MTDEELFEHAVRAMAQAYAPYSGAQVGAALETQDGSVIIGCNVENASYGLTICAERNAVFSAVAQGQRRFHRIAIASEGGFPPCGACRQVLAEFADSLIVLYGKPHGSLTRHTLAELLPQSFSPAHLSVNGR